MKTIKSIFAALFLVSFLSTGFANDNITESAMFIETRATSNQSLNLRLANVQANKLTIRLKDEQGTVLYFEKLRDKTAYFKHFNLSELNDGNYQFTISQANTADIIKDFTIQNRTVQVDYIKTVFPKRVANKCAAKVVCLSDDAANLHLINNTNQKVTVRLKDEAGQVLYFKKVAQNEVFQKRFILNQLPDGTYSFSIDDAKDQFEQMISIKDGVAQIKKSEPRA